MDASTHSRLQDEIGQGVPFRSPAQEAAVGLLRTASRLQRDFSRLTERYGLTFQQYNVLRILRGAREPLPTMDISDRMIEVTPGITRLLDKLEWKGLVTRQRPPDDRRQVLCSVTPQGLKLLSSLDEPMDRLDDTSLAMLSEAEQIQLISLLDRIRESHD